MSPFIAYPLLAAVVVAMVIGARRLKSSASIEDTGTDLVSPDAHTNPDHLGVRRDEALDISNFTSHVIRRKSDVIRHFWAG